MYSTNLNKSKKWDVVILGGGIAGLTASIYLANEGKNVLVLEKGSTVGGRGNSNKIGDAHLNLGAHALYTSTLEILNEVGVSVTGKAPKISGTFVFGNESKKMKAVEFLNLFLGSHLKWKEKMEFIRFYRLIRKLDLNSLSNISLEQYLSDVIQSNNVKQLVLAFTRVTTYTNTPELVSASVAIGQVRGASVLYVNNGWQSIVNDLEKKAIQSGVTIQTNTIASSVTGVYPDINIALKNGDLISTRSVLSTINPHEVVKLIGERVSESFTQKVQQIVPVRAACLDIVMNGLPNPKTNFAVGVDKPWYFSNHSSVARLSEDPEQNVVHVMKYLNSVEETNPANDEKELEGFLDLIQPGWRNFVVSRRFLPKLIVSNAIKKPFSHKNETVFNPDEIGLDGFYIAGDWIGDKEILLQASLTSAKNATTLINYKLAPQLI